MNIYNLTITGEEIEILEFLVRACEVSSTGLVTVDGSGPIIQALKEILERLATEDNEEDSQCDATEADIDCYD